MSFVLHRQLASPTPVAVAGRGVWLVDADGREYLDACAGAAVSALGHDDAEVSAAVAAQMSRLSYAHTSFFSSEPAERLAEALIKAAGSPFSKVFFTSSGSEAVEAAIKFARQHFVEKGEATRRHIIGRWQSYHGNTLGALSAGGNKLRRALYGPLLLDMHHIDACYAYRGQLAGETLDQYGLRMADQLEAKILELGPETVAAFVAEPVVGATLGAVAAPPSYFPRIREICDRYGVLLVFDEVMCGMGRLGSLFAFETVGVRPDIVCIAKGLGSGYQPIAAMLLTDSVVKPLAEGSGSFMHGHTYQGHPVACAAAAVVLSKISSPQMLARVTEAGKRLKDGLRARIGNSPHVGEIRGEGLFVGVEFVADADSKEPFPHTSKLNSLIKREAMDRGLLVYAMGGTLDGQSGDHVLLAPPFVISNEEIDKVVELFAEASAAALDRVLPRTVPAVGPRL
jgi:adenosylmethionine-8-amino-7-oxononanoate aminotransferase